METKKLKECKEKFNSVMEEFAKAYADYPQKGWGTKASVFFAYLNGINMVAEYVGEDFYNLPTIKKWIEDPVLHGPVLFLAKQTFSDCEDDVSRDDDLGGDTDREKYKTGDCKRWSTVAG
jgi:hypothetical protein